MSKLTFKDIREKCEPMKNLLVDEYRNEFLFLGFNRNNDLVTDKECGFDSETWEECEIKNWTIKEYKPTRKVNAWEWAGKPSQTEYPYRYLHRIEVIQEQHPDLEIEVEG